MGKCYFLLILVLFFSCKKEELILNKPDNIIYQNFGEESFISTIRGESYDPIFGNSFVSPSDSEAYLNIDVDMDSKIDFILTTTHHLDYIGRHSSVTKIIRINGINEGDSIRKFFGGGAGPNPEKLDSTIDISKNGDWTNQAYFLVLWTRANSYPYTFDDMLIGIKKGNKFGWLHVKPKDNNGICCLESAINLTDNNSILPGQKH